MGRFVPLQLVQKFDLIPKELATDAIRRSLHAFPGELPQEWADYLARDMRTFKLAELNARWMETATIRKGATHTASALANFLDFQSVVGPAGMAFWGATIILAGGAANMMAGGEESKAA